MESTFTFDQQGNRVFDAGRLRSAVAVLVLIVGLSPIYVPGQAYAQKETGVLITGNDVKLKPGFSFRRVSDTKVQVVQETEVQGKKAVAVVGEVYCACSDPKTDLVIFCSHTMDGSTIRCGTSSRCTCKPQVNIVSK